MLCKYQFLMKRNVLTALTLLSVCTFAIAGTASASSVSRWKDTSVAVHKYLFKRDILNYDKNESATLSASGACKVMGHNGGFAVYGYLEGKCTIRAEIRDLKTKKSVFRDSKTVTVKKPRRSPLLPNQSPIVLSIPGLVTPKTGALNLKNAAGGNCYEQIIQFAGRVMKLEGEWACSYGQKSLEIFNSNYYDQYIGYVRHRDFFPSYVPGLSISTTCELVAATLASSSASIISNNCSDPASQFGTFLCGQIGETTIIFELREAIASKAERPITMILTIWQSPEALRPNTEDLATTYLDGYDPSADYSGSWSACQELFGRPPR